MQYVGQTTRTFRLRWCNYKHNFRKSEGNEKCVQQLEHFCNNGHSGFLKDVSITLIDKTDGCNPALTGKILDSYSTDNVTKGVKH